MACITIAETGRRLTDTEAIRGFLQPHRIWYEQWDVGGRIGPGATDTEVLAAYTPEIRRLKELGGYATADVINVTPETPGLDAMLARFDKEHTHSEDEVRFTVAGRGVFWINPAGATREASTHGRRGGSAPPAGANPGVFAIEVSAGDLINVPAGVRHWFHLCDDRTIRCIRLFEDPGGWTPEYLQEGAHTRHAPLCWGPSYLRVDRSIKQVVEP